MANYVASALVNAQAMLNKKYAEITEQKRKQNPALMLGAKNSEILIPSHKILRTREDRPVKGYLFKRKAVGSATARTHNPSGTKGDSIETSFSWTTFAETFAISLKQADNNVYTLAEMMANEMDQVIKNLHSRIGTDTLAYLVSSRNQVAASPLKNATFAGTPDFRYDITALNNSKFHIMVASVLKQHFYSPQFDMIADSKKYIEIINALQQGSGNSTNTSWGSQDFANIIEGTELDVTASPNGSALAMPSGSFALLDWIPRQNRAGYGDYQSYNGGYGSIIDPLGSGLTFGIFARTTAADDSANNGYTQDQVTTFEISVDISKNLSPSSVANETPVLLFGQL